MKKFLTLLMTAILAFGVGWAEETVFYTLTPASGSNNAYANSCDITIDGITWNLTGNSQVNPWRIGGKSLSGVDRTLYSKTAMGSAITKVEVETGAASSITVNSMQLIVASDAAFSNVIDTSTATFAANSTITLTPSDTKTEWSKDAYYKFVFNITVSGTSNKFIEFKGAKFYAESSEIQPSTAPTADVTFDPASGSTVNIGSTVTLALNGSASGIKYTTDGSTPTADSDTYTAPIAVTGTAGDTFTIKAIAFNTNGSDYAASTAGVATATYTLQAEPVAQPGDEVIFKYGTGEEFAQNNGEVMNDSHKLGITIDFSKGSGTNDPKWYTAANGNARVYTGNTITVDAGSNTIETVTFTYDGSFPLTDPDVDGSWNAPEWTVGATSGTLTVKNTSRISTIAVKLAEGSTPTVAAPTIEGTTPFDGQTTVTITAADGASIFYTIDGTDPTTESTPYTAPFTIAATTTVKAIAVLDGVTSQVATKEFVANVTVANIAAYKQLAAGTDFKFTGNVTVTYCNGKNLYVKDDTGAALIYGSSDFSFTQGQVLASGWTAKTKNYNGLLEAETPNGLSATDQTVEVAPTEMAVNTITTANDNEYIIVKNVAVSAVDNRNFTITDANNNTIAGRTNFNSVTHPTDLTKRYDVTCCVAEYNSNVQLYPTAYEPVEQPVSHELTLTITPAGGDYDTPVTVTLAVENAQGDYEVYYTLNGSDPSGSSAMAYSVPFTLYESATVRAYVLDEELNEATAQATYTITLPEFTITPNVTPGTYYSSQTVQFTPANTVEPVSIVYTMTTTDGATNGEANGTFTLTVDKTATIEMMAEDGAGRTFEGTFDYTIEVFTPAEQF